MATQRRICPHTIKFEESMVDLAPSAAAPATPKVSGVPCIGPQCQFWHFEAGEDPNDGNCVEVITGIGVKLIAQLAVHAFQAGQQEAAATQAADSNVPAA